MRATPATESLRVALLAPCFWPEVRRGAERFARELGDGLIARGHRPYLITSHPGPPSLKRESGMPVLRLPRPPQGRLLRRAYLPYLTHVPLSYLALRARPFDIAHALYPADALAAARWRRVTGAPAVFSYMGIPDRPGLREYRQGLQVMERAVRGCDAVVGLSGHAVRAFDESLGITARAIQPGVDLEAWRPAAARADVPTVLCSASAAVPRKNVGLLVSAMALVRRELPAARLVLSASPEHRAASPASADGDGIEWRDLDDQRVLNDAYGSAWVTVLPATSEAFGLVLAESLACGTPVVGFADGGIPEVVDRPGIGSLFDGLDPRTLADAVLAAFELARDPATVTRCRERASELSVDRCVDRYLELYRELLERTRPASPDTARAAS